MGTRNLIAVVLDGEFKVAQYCQWDGYLSGQGNGILEFLNNESFDLEIFKDQLRKCVFLQEGQELEFSPYTSRDTGSDILSLIYTERELNQIELIDISKFAADGLFCEFAYVLDLDNEILEVYEGFAKKNENKIPDRFSHLTEYIDPDSDYGMVELWFTIPFNELPQKFKDGDYE